MDDLLRQLPVPVAIVDPGRRRLKAVNAPFADMLEIAPGDAPGIDLLDLIPPEHHLHVEDVLAAVSSGWLDCCHLQGRMRKPGGDELPVRAWIGSLDASRPVDRAVLTAVPVSEPHRFETWVADPDWHPAVLGTIGLDLRFIEAGSDAADVLGWDTQDLRGISLAEAVHPADVATLLLVLGRAAAERRSAAARLRLRRADGWSVVRCTISPLGEATGHFAVAISILPVSEDVEPGSHRLWRLEGHLSRIAAEVQMAGIRPSGVETLFAGTEFRGLTARQSEVLTRVIRGERTSEIARDLSVSESTLRNHLSTIYRSVGVHSKAELLSKLGEFGRPAAK